MKDNVGTQEQIAFILNGKPIERKPDPAHDAQNKPADPGNQKFNTHK